MMTKKVRAIFGAESSSRRQGGANPDSVQCVGNPMVDRIGWSTEHRH